ncbi:MAG TPA: hypothetical protein VNF29_06645 [Candidatus Binataceae bacterium]|nr:hypothetical protein [Candidatus Binataceae bacterium]
MSKRTFAMVIVLVALGVSVRASAGAQSAPHHAEPRAATQVHFFKPAFPAGAPRPGSCWTSSIAAPRPGAWRCMIGNEIHDPCFQVPPHRGQVVCDANPAAKQAGFALKLTKPLPESAAPASENPQPWIMQLADGSVCEPFTGTMPMVGGDAARWYCFDPAVAISNHARSRGLVTKIHHALVWSADRYAESDAGPPGAADSRRVRAERVNVVKVWE